MAKCSGYRLNGVPMCKTHDVKLVDRKTFDASGQRLEHPPVGNMICPVSGTAMAFNSDVDDLLAPPGE